MYNLLLLEEFSPIIDKFQLGNWIRIQVDEDIYRLRLISYEIDFDNLNTINTEFSDVTKTADSLNDIHDLLKQATSMASTYAYVSKQAANGHDADMTIEKMRAEGLDSALYLIKNADSEEITLGKNGLLARSYDDISDSYSDEQLICTHNILAYTIDNWRSVKCALGKMKLTIDGKTTWEYGLNSDFCISSKIIAGNIYSANYSSSAITGTRFNLDDGTFTLANGKIVFDGQILKLKGVEIDWSTTNESDTMWASINANAESISTEIKRAVDAENSLSTKINVTAEGIEKEILDTKNGLTNYVNETAKGTEQKIIDTENGLTTYIDITAGNITRELSSVKLTQDGLANNYITLSTTVSEMPGKIYQEISKTYETQDSAREKYAQYTSAIQQNADNISQKVSKLDYNGSNISSLINQSADTIQIEAQHINLNGAVTSNERFLINTDGSFNANYGMIGDFYVANGFLEANYKDLVNNITYSLIFYPPDKNNFSHDNPAIQIREFVYSQQGYRYPFSLTYGGRLTSNNAILTGSFFNSGSYPGVHKWTDLDEGKLHFFTNLSSAETEKNYVGAIEPEQFDATHSGIKIMNSVDYQFGGTAIYAGSDGEIKYLMNDGWSPNGITERHIFWDSVRVMGTLYDSSGSVITSDKRMKNSIEALDPSESLEFINSLSPKRFKYNDGESGRYHHGLIAQELKASMGEKDWGVYVKCKNDFQTEGIRYEELIPDLIAALQHIDKRLTLMESQK